MMLTAFGEQLKDATKRDVNRPFCLPCGKWKSLHWPDSVSSEVIFVQVSHALSNSEVVITPILVLHSWQTRHLEILVQLLTQLN